MNYRTALSIAYPTRFCPVKDSLAAYEAQQDRKWDREIEIERRARQLDPAELIDDMTPQEHSNFVLNLRALMNGTDVSQSIALAELRKLFQQSAYRQAAEWLDRESV